MINKLIVALVCLGFAANAGAEVNFDIGVDVKSIVTDIKSEASKQYYPYPTGTHFSHYSRDCRSFSFGPSAGPVSSPRAYLSSTEYLEVCRMVPVQQCHTEYTQQCRTVMVPGPNGTQVPRRECTQVPHQVCRTVYEQRCYTQAGRTFNASAQVNIAPRQLYPWETESFSVCLEGPATDLRTGKSPYSYDTVRNGIYDITYNLTPNYRVASAPDEDGMHYTSFTHNDGKFTLTVADKWASYYAAEQVAIKVELLKDGFWFFNSSKGEKTFTLDAAGNYELTFSEKDLVKTKEFVDEGPQMKGASKFYVKWGFKRLGPVSLNTYVKKGETNKIPL